MLINRLPLIPPVILKKHKVYRQSDTRFQACARLLQALWREQQNLPITSHLDKRTKKRRLLGSLISAKSALQGINFITPTIAHLAKRELVYREEGALYDEDRLWTNLLSSQPLCFNLFGGLKLNLELATAFFQALFPAQVHEVSELYFEHSPGRNDPAYTTDKTAFDVLVTGTTANEALMFIAIEVKYSESMNEPAPPILPRYDELSERSGLFQDPNHPALRKPPIQQLWREHLLSRAMIDHGLYQQGIFVIVHPAQNTPCVAAIGKYRQHLITPALTPPEFIAVSLEDCLATLTTLGETATAQALYARYLDFSQIDRVIFG